MALGSGQAFTDIFIKLYSKRHFIGFTRLLSDYRFQHFTTSLTD
jgi:hypothetical protein